MSTIDQLASPEKTQIRGYFDSIANRYDFLNGFLSLNLDHLWRKRACKLLLQKPAKKILDIGIGTGKFLDIFLKEQGWERAVGLDFSTNMLRVAANELNEGTGLLSADFHELPLQDASFDLVISSFTLRSIKDMPKFFQEVSRILEPGGRAAFLCLTRPKNRLSKMLYYPYLKYYLPSVGKLVSGHDEAYQFLSASIQKFQDPELTMQVMKQNGFKDAFSRVYTLGAATLIVGEK